MASRPMTPSLEARAVSSSPSARPVMIVEGIMDGSCASNTEAGSVSKRHRDFDSLGWGVGRLLEHLGVMKGRARSFPQSFGSGSQQAMPAAGRKRMAA